MKTSMLALALLAACASTSTTAPVTPIASSAAITSDVAIDLAARRVRVLDWLHAYREAGVYPTDVRGMPASVFVDSNGTRCPMAELIYRSGREDLVAAVAQEANGVRLADVHDGPLHDWMLASGLTRDEINMIQGAMNLDIGWLELETEVPQILAGRAQVRGKLEIAEIALRDNTAAALAIAAKAVPGHHTIDALATTPVHGAVVPAAAIAKAQPATGILRRRGRTFGAFRN